MYNSGRDNWAPEFLARRPDVDKSEIEPYLNRLYRVYPDFVYSVTREFAKSCTTPILVMPDDTVAHPLVSSRDVAALAPNAKSTVFPWRNPPELLEATTDEVRRFLRQHRPS